MKNRQHSVVIGKVVDKALVIVVRIAVESVPVIGPIFAAATLFADVKAIARRRTRVREAVTVGTAEESAESGESDQSSDDRLSTCSRAATLVCMRKQLLQNVG